MHSGYCSAPRTILPPLIAWPEDPPFPPGVLPPHAAPRIAVVETNPIVVGTAPFPIEELRGRGGRAGAHNIHENDPVEVAWRSDEVVVGAFFNGGVRAYDVRDPFHPRELGFLVPEAPPGSPAGAAQVNDVFVDENRLIYAVDRFTGGLYLVEADAWP